MIISKETHEWLKTVDVQKAIALHIHRRDPNTPLPNDAITKDLMLLSEVVVGRMNEAFAGALKEFADYEYRETPIAAGGMRLGANGQFEEIPPASKRNYQA